MDDNKKFWERTAKLYGPIQQRSNRALYEKVIELTGEYVPGKRVLELACGSGQITAPLWRKAQRWEATDFSPKMLAETQKLCPGLKTALADATALNYGDAEFDTAIIANGLHIMPMPEKALGEIHRVLEPGGILIAPTFVYEGKPDLVRMKLTELVGFKSYFKWKSHEFRELIENSGFEIIRWELIPASPLPEVFAAARKV